MVVRNVRKSRSPFARTARKGLGEAEGGREGGMGRERKRERETTKESIKGEKKESPVYGVTYAHAEPS